MYMEVQSIALAGLEKAQERLAAVAKRLSSGGLSAAYDEGGQDQVDLSAEMVALLEAKVATEANLKLVESANELASKTIDILG
jgi:flagellar basal body rod protein FlgG